MRYELKAEKRKETGKSIARKLRAIGKIPAVVYGAGEDTIPITVDRRELETILRETHGESVVIHLKVNRKSKSVLPKEIQRDPVTGRIIHVDFLVLHRGEKVVVEVPLTTVGESIGMKKGGILEVLVRSVEIRAKPDRIPPHIEVDISNLDIGDTLHIRDIKLPRGVEILEDPDEAILTIIAPRVEEKVVEEIPEEAPPPPEEKPEEQESQKQE